MTSLQEENIQNLDEYRALCLLKEYTDTIHDLKRKIAAAYHQKYLVEERILALRSRTSPLNRMPDELMLDIFKMVKHDDSLALGPILGVCRKWYQLAINSPLLWASIKVDLEKASDAVIIKRSQKYVEAAIRYNQQAPLSIDITLPSLDPLVHQASLRLLGVGDREFSDDHSINRYDSVYKWIKEALSLDPLDLILYNDITDAVSEVMTAVAGSNGMNLLRLRSFTFHYDPNYFEDWVLDGVFHHPTPILEELAISLHDVDPSGLTLRPIFFYPAPSLARIRVNMNCPLDDLLDSNSAVNSLYLEFALVASDAFPNHTSLRSLKYLCIDCLYPEQCSGQTILLPSLEDLALLSNCDPNCIKAPRLTTFRFLVDEKFNSDPTFIPYFPSLRRFHWLVNRKEDGESEPLREYLDQHPFVEEIAVVSSDVGLVKNILSRLEDALDDRALSIKGYRGGRGSDSLWSWSAPFPYESDEIVLN